MKNNIALVFVITLSIVLFQYDVNAQYYYKDIVSTEQLNKEFSILKAQQLRTIKLKSFEDNDEPSEGFFCEKKINKDYSQSEMISKSYITGQSLVTTSYNKDGLVANSVNSTPTITNTTEYSYDSLGRLKQIKTITAADDNSSKITETREYSYNMEGWPEKMLRKKNNVLVSTINFLNDENGNVIEENTNGKSNDRKYFYYYNEKHQLTDIVHYNEFAKKLLPDYIFEYNENGVPKQMTSVDESGRNYFVWRYAYTDKMLPEIQKCYSKEKRLLGTIEYEYQ
ncbi:MAG: hypothetical protein ABIP35_04355 [Ginsengibacter sp.]